MNCTQNWEQEFGGFISNTRNKENVYTEIEWCKNVIVPIIETKETVMRIEFFLL